MDDHGQLIEDLKATKAYLKKHGRATDAAFGPYGSVCIIAATHRALGNWSGEAANRFGDVLFALKIALKKYIRDGLNVVSYNADPTTTDQDVWDLFDKALADSGGMG